MRPQPVLSNATRCWRSRWATVSRIGPALMALAFLDAAFLPHTDVAEYAHDARLALLAPVLHALPREYPGASISLFLLPRILPMPYVLAFSMLAEVAVASLLLSSDGLAGRPGWNRRVVVYLALGSLPVLVARYDIVPALAAFLAVERARSGKWRRAWAWAVLGTLLKLFPVLLLPGFLIAEWRETRRWAWRKVAASGAVLAVVAAAQIARAPGSLASPFRYELHRGFEIESLASALSFLARPLHTTWISAYGGIETVGGAAHAITLAMSLASVLAFVAVLCFALRGRLTVEATSLAVLSIAVLGDKVFSAQYLIWLVPFWAYWEVRRGWLVAAGLTTVVFPLLWVEAALLGPGYVVPTVVAGVRDVVLLVATVRWLREQLREGRTRDLDVATDRRASPHAAGDEALDCQPVGASRR